MSKSERISKTSWQTLSRCINPVCDDYLVATDQYHHTKPPHHIICPRCASPSEPVTATQFDIYWQDRINETRNRLFNKPYCKRCGNTNNHWAGCPNT